MKDYKLKIHGQEFNVRVENINDASTEATVSVNGVEYLVEIEGAKPVKVSKPQVTRIPENARSCFDKWYQNRLPPARYCAEHQG